MKPFLLLALGLYVVALGSEEFFKGEGLTFLFGVMVFVFFILALLMRSIRIRVSAMGIPILLLACFALGSTFWSVDQNRTLYFAGLMMQLLMTTWITVSCVEREEDLKFLVWCLVLSSLYPAASLVIDYLLHGVHTESLVSNADRLTFGEADPNLTSYRFIVSIVAAVHLFLITRSGMLKLALLVLAALCAGAALLTGSRGGLIAMGISLAILFLANFRRHKTLITVAGAGFAVFLLVAFPMLPPSITERYTGIEKEVTTGTMALRKRIYKEAGASFSRHPVLGLGYFAFSTDSANHGGLGKAAHNDPLEIVVDLGVTGLFFYLLHFLTLLWGAATTPINWRGLTLSIFVAYGVASLSITLLAAKLPWITFGVIFGAWILFRNSGTPAPAPTRWSIRSSAP